MSMTAQGTTARTISACRTAADADPAAAATITASAIVGRTTAGERQRAE
jgi:hypothetical protein